MEVVIGYGLDMYVCLAAVSSVFDYEWKREKMKWSSGRRGIYRGSLRTLVRALSQPVEEWVITLP